MALYYASLWAAIVVLIVAIVTVFRCGDEDTISTLGATSLCWWAQPVPNWIIACKTGVISIIENYRTTVSSMIVVAYFTTNVNQLAKEAGGVELIVPIHACTFISNQFIVLIRIAGCANEGVVGITLVALRILARNAAPIRRILNVKGSTKGLTFASCQVEIVIWRVALPSHHIKYIWFGPSKSTRALDRHWRLHCDSKSYISWNRLIVEQPVVVYDTVSVNHFEGYEPNHKIINKLYRNLYEPSEFVIVPFLKHYRIFFGGFHIIRIEDDLAEMHVCQFYLSVKSEVPHVVRGVDYLWVNIYPKGITRGSLDPQWGQK